MRAVRFCYSPENKIGVVMAGAWICNHNTFLLILLL